jgi:ferredoxin
MQTGSDMGKDFGFTIHPGRQIDLDGIDLAAAGSIDHSVGAWNACVNCGSCSATCTAGLPFRKLHYRIRAGIPIPKEEALELLESCLLCGKCQLLCPRGIPLRYLSIRIMKTIQEHAEGIPSV